LCNECNAKVIPGPNFIKSLDMDFMRGIYTNANLSIHPKPQLSQLDQLKVFTRFGPRPGALHHGGIVRRAPQDVRVGGLGRTTNHAPELGDKGRDKAGSTSRVTSFESPEIRGWCGGAAEIHRTRAEPSPSKQYQIIYADPPWKYAGKLEGAKMGECPYETMTIDEICALPVSKITAKDCALFLWVTMPKLNEFSRVVDAWGFAFKTVAFVWVKLNPKRHDIFKGIGRWVQGNAELVVLATRGHPHRINKNIGQIVMAPRAAHSVKPDEVRKRIVGLMGDLPRIELFARQRAHGWDAWGDEIGKAPTEKPGQYQWEALPDEAAKELIVGALDPLIDLSAIERVEDREAGIHERWREALEAEK